VTFARIKSSLGCEKLGFGSSKPNPKYFCIWFRLTFVTISLQRLTNLYENANGFEEKFLKTKTSFELSEIFTLTIMPIMWFLPSKCSCFFLLLGLSSRFEIFF
jgi:hypothetical protein